MLVMQASKVAEAIFEYWNTRPIHKNWRKHRIFTPGMADAVIRWLKIGYTAEYLCKSIDNYHLCRTTKGTWWHDVCNKTWDFETFFRGGLRKTEFNWKRFEPERFILEEMYTDSHKRIMIQEARKRQKNEEIQNLQLREEESKSFGDVIEEMAELYPENQFHQMMRKKYGKTETVEKR